MINVAALKNHCAPLRPQLEMINLQERDSIHLVRTTDPPDFSTALLQSRLTTTHAFGVTHHEYTDEGIAVAVPSNYCRLIILGNIRFFRLWHCDVDMTELIINDWYEVDSRNLGDKFKGLRVLPSLCNEFSMPMHISSVSFFKLYNHSKMSAEGLHSNIDQTS